MSFALIAVDGVLRKLVGSSPIPEGIRLYRSLVATGHVILMSAASGTDRDQVRDWLELHGCTKHDFIEFACSPDAANHLRRTGYDIDLVVVPDPVETQFLIASGHTTMLFTHARYAQPSWRPDASTGVQAWATITQQVADLARMKAADERLNPDD